MVIAGFNLYRVFYVCPPHTKGFQRLVVAADEKEAKELVPGQFLVQLIEADISMVISKDAIPPGVRT